LVHKLEIKCLSKYSFLRCEYEKITQESGKFFHIFRTKFPSIFSNYNLSYCNYCVNCDGTDLAYMTLRYNRLRSIQLKFHTGLMSDLLILWLQRGTIIK
jgi:hypothetical protein